MPRQEFKSWRDYWKFANTVRRESRFFWSAETAHFIDVVRKTAESRTSILKEGALLYRAQKGVQWLDDDTPNPRIVAHTSSRMLPLRDRASEGRANPLGIPVLYAATVEATAVSEIRPWIGAEISVATLLTKRELRVVDLSAGNGINPLNLLHFRHLIDKKPSRALIQKVVWASIDQAFSQPVSREDVLVADYAPTQILTELFKSIGFDGIMYISQFGDNGRNLAIFDLDSVDLVKCEPHIVKAVKIESEPTGNAWFSAK